MPVDLQPYRDSLRAGGLTAAARRPALYDRLANEIPSEAEAGAVHLEGLAFDAICTQQLGWALVCMGAAAEQFQNAGREEDTRRCLTQTQQILEEGFPPYRELSEFVQELRLWVKTRAEEILGEQVSYSLSTLFAMTYTRGHFGTPLDIAATFATWCAAISCRIFVSHSDVCDFASPCLDDFIYVFF